MSEHDESPAVEPIPGLRGLNLNRQPERDLWPGISSRIAARRSARSRTFFAAAASALVVLSAMLSLRLAQGPQAPDPSVTAAPAVSAALTPRGPRTTDLRANRALIKANLRMTRQAEGQVRQALRRSPGDPSLQRLLDSTRDQRHELNLLLADRN
jgi:hypothetical protein